MELLVALVIVTLVLFVCCHANATIAELRTRLQLESEDEAMLRTVLRTARPAERDAIVNSRRRAVYDLVKQDLPYRKWLAQRQMADTVEIRMLYHQELTDTGRREMTEDDVRKALQMKRWLYPLREEAYVGQQ